MIFSMFIGALSSLSPAQAVAAPATPFPGFSWDVTASANDGALLPNKDFRFKFDLKEVRPTQYAPNGQAAFPASRGGRYSVGYFDGMNPVATPIIYLYTDGGCCSDHVMTLDLLSGNIYDHHQHSSGPWENINTPDPKDAVGVKAYIEALKNMTAMMQELRVPQSALNYLEQVQTTLEDGSFGAEQTLANDHVKFISFLSIDTVVGADVTLAYATATDRDLLVDFFTQEYDSQQQKEVQTWIGSGRVHVTAGKGTVVVPVKVSSPVPMAANQMEAVVAYAKVLPTGQPYTTAVSQEQATLWY